jgi:type I restriction enzyme, S subunit
MEVKPGYKQTEVGVIPEDWKIDSIGAITDIHVGRDLHEEQFSQLSDSTYRFPVYSNTVAEEGLYGYYSTAEYEGDSLTVVGRGVGLGTAFARKGGYGAIGRLLVLMPNGRADAKYLVTYINQRVSIFVETGGIPQLTGIQFSKYKVALPPLPEQHAIATALSDVDALLGGLDRLIAKKRDLKQAAMQQLLTSRTRLPGFHGDWEETTLGIIGKFKNGLNKDSSAFGHGSPFVNLMDVFGVNAINSTNHLGLVASTKMDQEVYDLRQGDILFIRSSVKPSGVGLTAVVERDLTDTVYSGFLIRFRDKGALDIGFKKHCFYAESFRKKIIAASSVSANTNINQTALGALTMLLPPTKAEQSAIAAVLSDMDAELAALEARHDKTRALKQAMMQELLTGRTRLISHDATCTEVKA